MTPSSRSTERRDIEILVTSESTNPTLTGQAILLILVVYADGDTRDELRSVVRDYLAGEVDLFELDYQSAFEEMRQSRTARTLKGLGYIGFTLDRYQDREILWVLVAHRPPPLL
jgi:hypothetical protein